eukprot:TRINITY_DN8319_c0_g3_i1.p1 TRINITY_DN8319_c0_g3~~TRINITY_DN8319_c0_g3_i1.p1  ORF type:complete len:505 (+),score=87.81 TRINITY_DN8319_c0_g3_i1:184-1515(+)
MAPLFHCMAVCWMEGYQWLLDFGASETSKSLSTPFHKAVWSFPIDNVRFMANVIEASPNKVNKYGETVLCNAIERKHPDVIVLALRDANEATILRVLKKYPLDKNGGYISVTETGSSTLLYLSCKVGNLVAVQVLLKNGADPTIVQKPSGSVCAHTAAYYSRHKVLDAILSARPDSVGFKNKVEKGEYPITNALYPASSHNPSEITIIRILKETDWDLYQLSKNGVAKFAKNKDTTPLHLASAAGNLDLVKNLVKDFSYSEVVAGRKPIDVSSADCVTEFLRGLEAGNSSSVKVTNPPKESSPSPSKESTPSPPKESTPSPSKESEGVNLFSDEEDDYYSDNERDEEEEASDGQVPDPLSAPQSGSSAYSDPVEDGSDGNWLSINPIHKQNEKLNLTKFVSPLEFDIKSCDDDQSDLEEHPSADLPATATSGAECFDPEDDGW